MRPGTNPVNGRPRARAVVAVGTGGGITAALTNALADARVEHALREAEATLGRRPARIAIRPVLPPGLSGETPPLAYADPELVEALVTWLGERGRTDVTIAVAGPGGVQTATRVGYKSAVRDLTSDMVTFQYGGLIGEHEVSGCWSGADVRILVAKARTDRQLMYCGAIVSALGAIPKSEALARRFSGAYEIAECAADVLERLPVTLGIIDAWACADESISEGGGGSGRATGSVLASTDLLALDWVLGELMGLDGPELNPVVKAQLVRRGAIDIDRWGDLTEWQPWRNAPAMRSALAQTGAGRRWGSLAGWREVPWTAR
jgi:uncharacterized protein (DUF362 family)